jgi:hypothetical protein
MWAIAAARWARAVTLGRCGCFVWEAKNKSGKCVVNDGAKWQVKPF